MINIYTDISINNRKKFLSNQTKYLNFMTLKDGLDNIDKEILYNIDKAVCISDDKIEGIFGVTDIGNISNGAKTVINLRHMLKKSNECYIDITSCGDNALDVLADVLNQYGEDKSINLLMRVLGNSSTKEVKLNVNNQKIVNAFREVKEVI